MGIFIGAVIFCAPQKETALTNPEGKCNAEIQQELARKIVLLGLVSLGE